MNTPNSVFFISEIDLQLAWSWDKVLSIVLPGRIHFLEGQVDQVTDTWSRQYIWPGHSLSLLSMLLVK